jgi:hypothetical protein
MLCDYPRKKVKVSPMMIIDPEMYAAYQRTHGLVGAEPSTVLDMGFGNFDPFQRSQHDRVVYGYKELTYEPEGAYQDAVGTY